MKEKVNRSIHNQTRYENKKQKTSKQSTKNNAFLTHWTTCTWDTNCCAFFWGGGGGGEKRNEAEDLVV